MRRLRCRAPAARRKCAGGACANSPPPDVRQRHDAALEVGEARCPVCRFVLVARMGPHGPHIPCLCRPGGMP
jgi:hypothetical protein